MVIDIHINTSYLTEMKAWSIVGGHHFLSSNAYFLPNNGAVMNITLIIKTVMSLVAEYELGALFINEKYAVTVQKTLEEMVHTQPLATTHMDNYITYGMVNKKIQSKPTKSMDVIFHWLRDRECH